MVSTVPISGAGTSVGVCQLMDLYGADAVSEEVWQYVMIDGDDALVPWEKLQAISYHLVMDLVDVYFTSCRSCADGVATHDAQTPKKEEEKDVDGKSSMLHELPTDDQKVHMIGSESDPFDIPSGQAPHRCACGSDPKGCFASEPLDAEEAYADTPQFPMEKLMFPLPPNQGLGQISSHLAHDRTVAFGVVKHEAETSNDSLEDLNGMVLLTYCTDSHMFQHVQQHDQKVCTGDKLPHRCASVSDGVGNFTGGHLDVSFPESDLVVEQGAAVTPGDSTSYGGGSTLHLLMDRDPSHVLHSTPLMTNSVQSGDMSVTGAECPDCDASFPKFLHATTSTGLNSSWVGALVGEATVDPWMSKKKRSSYGTKLAPSITLLSNLKNTKVVPDQDMVDDRCSVTVEANDHTDMQAYTDTMLGTVDSYGESKIESVSDGSYSDLLGKKTTVVVTNNVRVSTMEPFDSVRERGKGSMFPFSYQ